MVNRRTRPRSPSTRSRSGSVTAGAPPGRPATSLSAGDSYSRPANSPVQALERAGRVTLPGAAAIEVASGYARARWPRAQVTRVGRVPPMCRIRRNAPKSGAGDHRAAMSEEDGAVELSCPICGGAFGPSIARCCARCGFVRPRATETTAPPATAPPASPTAPRAVAAGTPTPAPGLAVPASAKLMPNIGGNATTDMPNARFIPPPAGTRPPRDESAIFGGIGSRATTWWQGLQSKQRLAIVAALILFLFVAIALASNAQKGTQDSPAYQDGYQFGYDHAYEISVPGNCVSIASTVLASGGYEPPGWVQGCKAGVRASFGG